MWVTGYPWDVIDRDSACQALDPYCPYYAHAIELLGRRWTGTIVRALLAGCSRFGEIKATVPGLSERLLSERLRELEREGIVERRVYPEVPVRIEYLLTPKGEDLLGVVEVASAWARRWLDPPRHRSAGDAGPPSAG